MKVILTLTKTIMANYFKLFGIALLRTISNLKISAIHLVSLLSFKINIQKFYLVYLIIAIFPLVIRTILELWAISRAPKLSKEYLEEKNVDKINVKKWKMCIIFQQNF